MAAVALLLIIASSLTITSSSAQTHGRRPIIHLSIPYNEKGNVVYHSEDTPLNSMLGLIEVLESDNVTCRSSHPLVEFPRLSGSIFKMVLAKPLDREEEEVVPVLITCTNVGGAEPLSNTANFTIIVIDVNDEDPVFTNNKDATVKLSENVPIGHYVTTVSALDRDAGDNGRVEYFLMSEGDFQSVMNPVGDGDHWMDYEDDPLLGEGHGEFGHYEGGMGDGDFGHYEGEGVDDGHPPHSTTSEFPTDIEKYDGPFRIDNITGAIYTNAPIDREAMSEMLIHVEAIDLGLNPRHGMTRLRVEVTDVNDNSPTMLTKQLEVRENQAPKTLVGQLQATDLDEGENAEVVFHLPKPSDEDEGERMERGGNTALERSEPLPFVVRKNGKVFTTEALDREKQELYLLVVIVRDKGQPRQTTTATVTIVVKDVNDNPPVITSRCLGDDIDVYDDHNNAAANDEADHGGSNQEGMYVSQSGKLGMVDERPSVTGLSEDVSREELSRGNTEPYVYSVDGFSGPTSSSRKHSEVSLDHKPLNNDTHPGSKLRPGRRRTLKGGEVRVDWAVPDEHRVVYNVKATDSDSGNNAILFYSLGEVNPPHNTKTGGPGNPESSEYGSIFGVDSSSGKVFLRRYVLASDPLNHILNVSVRDGGNPSRSASCLLNVTLDVNVTMQTPPPSTETTPNAEGGSSSSRNSTNGTLGPDCMFHSSSMLCFIAVVRFVVNCMVEFPL